jgi:hypothetical protein
VNMGSMGRFEEGIMDETKEWLAAGDNEWA